MQDSQEPIDSTGKKPQGRRWLRWLILFAAFLLVIPALPFLAAFLLSDPPPPPETAPLEIIPTTSVKPGEFCLLNREELGAGTHEVSLISDVKPASVRILDSAGGVIFEGEARPQNLQDPPEEMPADMESRVVKLEAGEYLIECKPEGDPVSTAHLKVAPARPGYENLGPDL